MGGKRISKEKIIEIVRKVTQEKKSLEQVSRETIHDVHQVQLYVALYNLYGYREILKNTDRIYTEEFREMVIVDMAKNGLSLLETCVKYRITKRATLRSWKKKYLTAGESKGKTKTIGMKEKKKEKENDENYRPRTAKEELAYIKAAPTEEIRRLREENMYLRAENALLKKLGALSTADKSGTGKK